MELFSILIQVKSIMPMSNPRLWFKINKFYKVLVPVASLNAELDRKYSASEDIMKLTYSKYGSYTKNYINVHINDAASVFYWSDEYHYDPDDNTFDFYSLNECLYKDIEWKSSFDANTEYGAKQNSSVSLLEEIKQKYPCPQKKDGFYVEESVWNFLVRNIIKNIPTMLIGPTGAGKTELVIRAAEKLGIECSIYDMGSMIDPLSDLLGTHRLKNGNSIFDYAKFTYDVQKPGIILLDELSRAPLMTNNILFPCLDSRKTLPIEIADSSGARSVKVHPECVFIATANIGAEYSGTNDIDAALMNRFIPIQLDYLDKDIEADIIKVRSGITRQSAEKIVSVANLIRAEYLNSNISRSVSTRETIACGDMVADGFTELESILKIVCSKYQSNVYNNEYSLVKKIIMKS